MGGLADERDAVFRELPRAFDRERKQIAAGLDVHASEIQCDCFSAASDNSASLSAIRRSASFGEATHTTLQRSPGNGTNTQGPSGVWNSVEIFCCGREW